MGAQGLGKHWGFAMAKKTRKKPAAKAAKKSMALTKGKSAKKKVAARKTALVKKRRKSVAKNAPKTAAPKTAAPKAAAPKAAAPTKSAPITLAKPAPKENVPPPRRKSIVQRIEGAVSAAVDILTDAEQLHHRLDPDPSKDRDPE